LKNDLLSVFKKSRFVLGTKSKCQYDSEVLRQNSHIEDDLILVLKKQTPTVKVITVRLRVSVRNISVQKERAPQGIPGKRVKEGRKKERKRGRKEGDGRKGGMRMKEGWKVTEGRTEGR
jgi:hypothetical protein